MTAGLTVDGVASGKTITLGESVDLLGTCTNLTSYYLDNGPAGRNSKYFYQYYDSSDSSWHDIDNNTVSGSSAVSDSEATSWQPAAAGTYKVRVKAYDNNLVQGSNCVSYDRFATSDEYTITVKNTYAVTYNQGTVPTNGGAISGSAANQTKIEDETLTLRDNSYTSTGYTQDGWTTSDLGSTKDYDRLGSYTANGPLSLYPHWNENMHNVTVVAGSNGKISLTGESDYTTSNLTASAGVATKDDIYAQADAGYLFTGWTVTGGTVGTDITFDSTNNASQTHAQFNASNDGITVTANFALANVPVTVKQYVKSSASGSYSDSITTSTSSPNTIAYTPAETNLSSVAYNTTMTFTPTPATGYEFAGWYDGTGTAITEGVNAQTNALTVDILAAAEIRAYFNRGGYVTFKSYDDSTLMSGTWLWYNQYPDTVAPSAPNRPGYSFAGWSTDGTAVGITDLNSYVMSADVTFKAVYNIYTYTVTINKMAMDNAAAGYTDCSSISAFDSSAYEESNGDGAMGTMDYRDTLTPSSTAVSGYQFVGWYVVENTTAAASTDALASNTNFSTESLVLDDPPGTCYHIYALYKKVYYLTLYNTYDRINGQWVVNTAPPKKVAATAAGSGAVTTYTYSKGSGTTGENVTINTNNANYEEGNKLQVLAGDSVTLTYSAMTSSAYISGIFFNNNIRYTTEKEEDNLYKDRVVQVNPDRDETGKIKNGDDDWPYTYYADTTIYADPVYYPVEKADIIRAQTYICTTINQTAHTVTFPIASDHLNIDLEIANKKRIFFSDTDRVKITSKNLDNYYAIAEDISGATPATDGLAIQAAGSTKQINVIAQSGIEFYYCDELGNYTTADGTTKSAVPVPLSGEDASKITITSSSVTSTSSGSTPGAAITFGGTMPATNVYVKLNATRKFNVYLDSKIQSDKIANKTKFCQVANLTISDGTANILVQPTNTVGHENDQQGPVAVDEGESVVVSYAFTDEVEGVSWSTYYTFAGWYTGTTSAPDLSGSAKSTDATFTFKPTENTCIWAIGVRDLYINGSKYITGATKDWNPDPDHLTDNTKYRNFKMSYDASQGLYYWKITDAMFNATSPTPRDFTVGSFAKSEGAGGDSHLYWSNSNNKGNSFFTILDTAVGVDNDSNKSIWSQIFSFENTDHIHYGKVYPAGDTYDYKQKEGSGFISFSESRFPGYSADITIYLNPSKVNDGSASQQDKLYVKSTPIYTHIYASNGYKGIDSTSDSSNHDGKLAQDLAAVTPEYGDVTVQPINAVGGSVLSSGDDGYFSVSVSGNGWNPHYTDNNVTKYDCEGHVNDWIVGKKGGAVRITKTLSSATYKVSYFNVYNLATDKVKSYEAKTGADNTYYVDIQTVDGKAEDLYVLPILEYASADMTVLFDATQLNTNVWGDFVACYAWYADDNKPCGVYPGQMMIPDATGNTWSAKIPSKSPADSSKSLVGITFTNYFDGKKTWINEETVLSNLVNRNYNSIEGREDQFDKVNFKAQTYDYREPVAFYANKTNDEELTMKFGLKEGNSDLIKWDHSDLTGVNILTYQSTPGYEGWDSLEYEYLTDSDGNITDLNGVTIEDAYTPSFYILAKGEVAYDNNVVQRVFGSGKSYEAYDAEGGEGKFTEKIEYTSYKHETEGEIDLSHAVQWYIYNASGEYVTSMLSSGFADREDSESENPQTFVASELKKLGYGVDGKSVMIAYDLPRYCYGTKDGIANTADSFDVYRFCGQWYQKHKIDKVTVNAEVGLITQSGYEFADSNTDAYGTVNVSLNTTGFTYSATVYANTNGPASAFTTLADKDHRGITFNATSMNFDGWYYYDSSNDMYVKIEGQGATGFRPSYSGNSTFYAMYKASALYRYHYQGREGSVSYVISGGDLTVDEMADKNKVSTSRTNYSSISNVPSGTQITRFKKDINFGSVTITGNDTPYYLEIGNVIVTDETFTMTYWYDRDGDGDSEPHSYRYNNSVNIPFNTTIDLRPESAAIAGAVEGKVFKGWYEYGTDNLVSTNVRYGQVLIKNTVIEARYDTVAYSGLDEWEIVIDDNGVTHEMYSTDSGMFYNDTIVHARKKNMQVDALPEGAEVGILVLNDGRSDLSLNVGTDKLELYADSLSDGATGRIGKTGRTVTKVVASNLTVFSRADLAVRADYSANVRSNYVVYAYVKINNEYTFTSYANAAKGSYTLTP